MHRRAILKVLGRTAFVATGLAIAGCTKELTHLSQDQAQQLSQELKFALENDPESKSKFDKIYLTTSSVTETFNPMERFNCTSAIRLDVIGYIIKKNNDKVTFKGRNTKYMYEFLYEGETYIVKILNNPSEMLLPKKSSRFDNRNIEVNYSNKLINLIENRASIII